MYSADTECPVCSRKHELTWPEDENFICPCGNSGFWDHYIGQEEPHLYWFWDHSGEED